MIDSCIVCAGRQGRRKEGMPHGMFESEKIRDYINNAKQKPTLGKRTYTDLEEANKRIKELEIENMTLRMKNVGLFKIATNLYTRMANLTELNIRNMEQEMGEYDEEE